MADNILGISGSLDISDIEKSIDRLYGEVSKIEGISKEMATELEEAFTAVGKASKDELEEKARKAMGVLSRAFKEIKETAEKEVTKTEKAISRLQDKLAKVNVERSDTMQGSKTYEKLTRQIGSLATQIQNQQEALAAARENARAAGENYAEFLGKIERAKSSTEAFNELNTTIEGTTAALEEDGNAAKQLGHDLDDTADGGVNAFSRLEKAAIGFFTLQKAKEFIGHVYQVRSEIEGLETSFRILIGNADQADALLSEIRKFAVETPMQLKDLAGAAQTMMGFGIATEDVMEDLEAIGNVAMGDSQKFQSLALAFSQMSATGKLMGQDLLQMINAGFNPLEQMSRTTGKSIAELKEEMADGAISADMVRQAFIDATKEGGKFNGMLEAQSKSLAGAYSNMQGAIDDMLNEIGQKSEGIMSGAIDVATLFAKNYETVGKVMIGLIGTYGSYKVAVMAVTAAQSLQAASTSALTAKTIIYRGWVMLATKAQALLNATMLANPYVLCATAIAGVATALWALRDSTTTEEAAAKTLADRTEELRKKQEDLNNETEEAIRNATDEANATGKQEEAMQFLINKYPELIKQYIDEKGHLRDIIGLKERIAELNGENQRKEAIQDSYNAFEDARQIHNDLIAIHKRFKENHGNWSEQDRLRYNQIMELYRQQSGKRDNSYSSMVSYYRDLAMNAKEQFEKQFSSHTIIGFTKTGGPLEQYTDAQLKALQETLKGMKGQETAFVKELQASLTGEDREGLLARVTAMIEARNAPKSTPAAQLQALKQNLDEARKALSDFDQSQTEYTTEAAKTERERLQKAVDDAEKAYKDFGGKEKNGGNGANAANKTAKEKAARHQKQLEAEWAYQDELRKIKEQGANAAADAEIAAEENAAIREQKERKAQHERTKRELEAQRADIYKSIYEQRKRAYETANKDKKYTDTPEGALGWDEKYMKGTLTANEQEYFDARNAIIEAGLAKEDAEWARYEQERKKSLDQAMREYLTEYGEGLEQELAITEDYQEQIDKARAAGEEGKALLLERQMQEALSNAKLKNLKRSSEYVRAFEDLSNASSETLKSLIAKFEAAKESAAQNLTPDQLREYTSTLQQMYDELDSRNPFDTLAKSIRELAAAQDEVKSAQEIYNKVMAGETVINTATGNAYTEEEAVKRLTAAKDNEAKVYNKLTKAATSCASRLNSFASTLINLGDMVGGKLGDTLGAFGNMLGSIGGAFDNIKSINVNATGLEKTMGQVSAVAGTVSAMVEMNRQLDSILPDQESLYEHYAAKQREINEKRQQMLELEIAQMNERLQNEHWFYENGLTQLRKNAELNAEYAKAYGEIASAPQEVYKEAKSGFSKWAPAIIGAIVGIVAGIFTFGAGAGAGAALGAAIGSAIGGTAIGAALGSTVIAMIGTAIFSGVGAALGNAVRAGIDGIMYDPNQTAAINNMRVQTRHKTFFRSEKTQDLKSWVKENWGQDLFEDIKGVQLIDTEIAKKLLEEGPTLVGETRETLEKLMEYSEKIRDFIDQIHEYVSQAFSPLVDNLVDALWDWLTSGKNVLDSFREYAADTFKGIAQDALRAMANKLIFEPFQEQLENLTIAYSTNQIDETAYMAGVAAFAAQAQEAIEKNLPAMQNAAEVMQKAFEAVGISITGIESESINAFSEMRDAFKSALLDMEGDAEDFGKKVKEILYEKLVERFVMNVPFTVNIDGQDTVFNNLDDYLDSVSERYYKIANVLTKDEYDRQIKETEEKIAAQEAAIQKVKNNTESNIKYWQGQYSYYINRGWGYLLAGKGEENMTEQELAIYRSMQTALDQINKAKEKGNALLAEEEAKLATLLAELEEIKKSEVYTDEERIIKEQELQTEIDETLKRLQKEAKRYADMAGWTLEQKIDASPLANIGDSLLSALQDTSKSVEDWKREIVKAMTDDLIKEVVYNQEFEDKMRQFQEWYVAIMTGEDLYTTDAEGNKIKLDIDFDLTKPEGVAAALQWLADQMAQTATAAAEDADKINAAMGQIGGNNDESPFDGLRDSFLSALTDMDGDAESFKRKLQETLVKDLMERQVLDVPLTVTIDGEDKVFDNFDKYSEDWNKRYLDAVKSGNTELADALIDELMQVYGLTMQQAEELRERLKEIAKDTTFKDMTNSWVSNLMDFNATAEDWAENIGRTMAQKIIEQMIVPTLIQPLLDNLQTAFDTAMSEHGDYGTDWDWKKVIGADGVQEALQAIQAAYPELKETITAILAALNITPAAEDAKEAFNDLTGTIISGLTDAEMTAEEFSKNIARTLTEQLMKQIVESQFAETMKGIQEDWAKALESGDTSAIEAIRQRIVQLYKDAGRATDELRGIFEEVKEGDTTFKDMADSWVSALFDMDSTASDFGRQIGRTLVEKLVKELVVTKQLQKYLDDIQTAFDNAIGKEGATIESVLAAVTPAINAAVAATEQWKPVIEEISKAFQEIDKSTPLDNIRSNFLSQLMDMKSDTKDFARSINEILTEAFIDRFVLGEEFDKRLEEWKNEYASIMGGNYSDEDRATLLKQLRQAITTAKEGYTAEAQAIHELMGTANYADQQATMNLSDRATYEQADMLVNVNVSQLMVQERILQAITGGTAAPIDIMAAAPYTSMAEITSVGNTAKQILSTLQRMSDITTPNKDGLTEISRKFDTANERLLAIVRAVQSIKDYVANNVAASRGILSRL